MINRQALASAHDLDLVALGAAGDRAAFGELVRRHGSAVRGLLRRMGADGATADDVAQDAFLAAFEQTAEFRGEGLKSLSEPERICVSLCYGAGLSHAEAAAALNAPLGTVKSHVKRGLDKLRSRLSPSTNGDGDGGQRRQIGA